MPQATSLQLNGVATHKNRLSQVKEGALARAQNVIIDRESLVEPRRGFAQYGSDVASASDGSIQRLIAFDEEMIAIFNDSAYSDGGTGEWTLYSSSSNVFGNFEINGTSVEAKPRDAQALGGLYVTSEAGVYYLDDFANAWVKAGALVPLDGSASTTGSSGFLATGYNAGYRFLLYYINEQNREIVSGVSPTVLLQNTSGGDRNGAVTLYLPSGVSTSYYVRAYRSEAVAGGTPPSDELQQVYEAQLTSAQVSALTFTFTDTTTDALRGAKIYTAPSEPKGGIANDNAAPPLAADMAFYRGIMLYGNIIGKHRFTVALLGTGSSSLQYYTSNGTTTNNSAVVTGITSTTTLRAGMQVSGTGVAAGQLILTVDSATQVTLTAVATASGTVSLEFRDRLQIGSRSYFGASAASYANNRFLVSTGGTASQNIEATARDIVRVVNNDSSALVYARYESGFDDTPGYIHLYERALGGSAFQLATTRPEAFSPALPTSQDGTAISDADNRPSFVIPAKEEQPEAVPLGGAFRCGETPIKRLLALRDAVVVLSDTIGLITGNDIDSLRYEALDSTTKLIGAETAVVLNDAVYCMSSQGVVRINTTGVQIASRDIERDLINLTALSNFADQAWGLAYESDRAYWLFHPTDTDDDYPVAYWRYNAFTEAWTHGLLSATCGVVNPVDDKFYLGYYDNTVRKERKAYDYTDYADDQMAITISGAGSAQTTITVNSTTGLAAGMVVVQSTREIRISSVTDGTHLLMAESATWSNGAAIAYTPIMCVVETLPFSAGNAGIMKHFTDATFLFRDAEFESFSCSVASNFLPDQGTYELTLYTADYSSAWTVQPTGSDVKDEQPIRTLVPGDVSRAHWLRLRLTFSICRETMALAGISAKFRELSQRFQGAVRG